MCPPAANIAVRPSTSGLLQSSGFSRPLCSDRFTKSPLPTSPPEYAGTPPVGSARHSWAPSLLSHLSLCVPQSFAVCPRVMSVHFVVLCKIIPSECQSQSFNLVSACLSRLSRGPVAVLRTSCKHWSLVPVTLADLRRACVRDPLLAPAVRKGVAEPHQASC